MSEYRLLDPSDTIAQGEVIQLAMQTLRAVAQSRRAQGDSELHDVLETGRLGTSPNCIEASDAATRAAHTLGISAMRELIGGRHYVTSFSRPDTPPSPTDLILCMTWGQFNRADLRRRSGKLTGAVLPFFGTREELLRTLPLDAQTAYSHEHVQQRQVVHAPSTAAPEDIHHWLPSTPEDLHSGRYRIGMSRHEALLATA